MCVCFFFFIDSFKKDGEPQVANMSSIERDLDAFEDIHQQCPKFNVPESRLSLLHYAYELYELIECLGDRKVWLGWDVPIGSKEEISMKLPFDIDQDKNNLNNEEKLPHRERRGSTSDNERMFRNSTERQRNTGREILTAAFAEAEAAREYEEIHNVNGYESYHQTRHLDGFKDWLNHPIMSAFCLQWAHSLCDVAYALKKQPKTLDPFSEEVLGFARKDPIALQCANKLQLFSSSSDNGGLKSTDKEASKKDKKASNGCGRFKDAYVNFKTTTGQV